VLIVSLIGVIISLFVALMIKGIFMVIKFLENTKHKSGQKWEGTPLITKPLSH
jgi:hypothetical protein